jgi:hypothetical protein
MKQGEGRDAELISAHIESNPGARGGRGSWPCRAASAALMGAGERG